MSINNISTLPVPKQGSHRHPGDVLQDKTATGQSHHLPARLTSHTGKWSVAVPHFHPPCKGPSALSALEAPHPMSVST